MHRLFKTKAVADTIVHSLLSHTGFLVAIFKIFGKMVDRDIDVYNLQDMEYAWIHLLTPSCGKSTRPRATKPSKIQSDIESAEESRCNHNCLRSSSCQMLREKFESKRRCLKYDTEFGRSFDHRRNCKCNSVQRPATKVSRSRKSLLPLVIRSMHTTARAGLVPLKFLGQALTRRLGRCKPNCENGATSWGTVEVTNLRLFQPY